MDSLYPSSQLPWRSPTLLDLIKLGDFCRSSLTFISTAAPFVTNLGVLISIRALNMTDVTKVTLITL